MVIFSYNDLGMHCMNDDFSQLMILPPFNTLRATVIRRGEEPDIRTEGVTVSYRIPSNTTSAPKTNFWTYVGDLLGVSPQPDVGLTGNSLAGTMEATAEGYYEASGIPLTPINDSGVEEPFPLAEVTLTSGGQTVARTQTVVPVSWEMHCDECHTGSSSWEDDVLGDHDRLHGTSLRSNKPVACASCHSEPPLAPIVGPGNPDLPTLSRAIHHSHAQRVNTLGPEYDPVCYACHPGTRTRCQRDIHSARGMDCLDCHGDVAAVGAEGRQPWADLPRCGSCHEAMRPGFEYEEPGKLFTQSRGHEGVPCQVCHGSPHAITPTTNSEDNVQAIGLQGHAGPINDCTVCHIQRPDEGFEHER